MARPKIRLYAGMTLDELDGWTIDHLRDLAEGGSVQALQTLQLMVRDTRKRAAELEAERKRRERAARARRERPEQRDERGQMLWSLRRYQEIASAGGVAGAKAQAQADAILAKLREMEAESRERPEDLSPEEWAARVREDAAAASDEDLEVYVHEWLRRAKLSLIMDGGEPRLVRRRRTG